jgi:YesN/AraC family two-component response regulator
MRFYYDEIARLNKTLYPHDDLTKKITEAKLYIGKHFSENINLDKIADKALVSKFQFIHLFKKYYGRTPNQYLQEVRIQKCKKVIAERKCCR